MTKCPVYLRALEGDSPVGGGGAAQVSRKTREGWPLKNSMEDEFVFGIVRHTSLPPENPESVEFVPCEVLRKGSVCHL